MNRPERSKRSVTEIVNRLRAELTALTETTRARPPSVVARRRLDADLGMLISCAEMLLRNIDPIHQPNFVFDPGDPVVVGRFIALAMLAQRRLSLSAIERFYGSGIYALYYRGTFGAYEPISGTETPIYVGKADPRSDTARTPMDQGIRLFNRLRDHLRSIGKAEDTLAVNDFDCRSLVVQSGWQGAAEDYLINLFHPIWNNETGVCHGLGKHGDAPSTRANLRSPWDTLHPGREWAWRDPNIRDARSPNQILTDLTRHFSTNKIYENANQIFDSFVDELRQF